MKVKICGLTNLEDAQTALEAGADFLGFIFYPLSKRAITVEQAQEITSKLRLRNDCPILVGVFVNEAVENIVHVLTYCQLDLAQLSGDEVPYIVADKRSPLFGRSYKAIQPQSLAIAEAEAEWYQVPQGKIDQPSLLIDTYHPTLRGGTGEAGNWDIGAKLAKLVPGLMLAGGLNVNNIADAIKTVHPYAVDVASGVEAEPGKKNPNLVREFIRIAKEQHLD